MTPDEWLSAALRGEPVEWGALSLSSCALLAKCEALEVSELLHHQLARNPQFRCWPADGATAPAPRAPQYAARQLVRSAEIAQVLQLLASNGIRAVVFKGAA